MNCHRCLLRAAKRSKSLPFVTNLDRTISTTSARRAQAVTAQTTTAINPRPEDRPAATSTSAAQPFSTPLSPSPDRQDLPIQPEQTKAASRIQSSVPAGTVLKGLNFVKGKQDPVALEDSEYPAWLWSVLREKSDAAGNKGTDGEGDLFSKSKKQRRKAAKALRKQQLLHPESLAPKIPVYEQSVDLPAGDGSLQGALEAGEARQELTKAMREKRRSKIKEDNFLRAMR